MSRRRTHPLVKRVEDLRQQLKGAQATLRANQAFAKLTKAQKRVRIAQDVIAQVKLGQIKAQHNTYIDESQFDNGDTDLSGRQLSELVGDRSCDACGIGSVFIATVRRRDAFEYDGCGVGDADMLDYLRDFWDPQQLRLIEAAFDTPQIPLGAKEQAAVAFRRMYEDVEAEEDNADELLVKIMENVIRNRGTFRPDREPGIKEQIKNMNAPRGPSLEGPNA